MRINVGKNTVVSSNDFLKKTDSWVEQTDKDITILKNRCHALDATMKNYQYGLFSNIRRELYDAPFALGLITDIHFNNAELRYKLYNSVKEIDMFKNIIRNINVTDSYVLGDLINGDYNNATFFNDVCELQNHVDGLNLIHGNHDTGAYFENLLIKDPSTYGSFGPYLLPNRDLYEFFYKKNNHTKIDTETLAFYKDYEEQKIRLIHINVQDCPDIRDDNNHLIYNPTNWKAITPKQIQWLVDNAFDFTEKENKGEGWKIIILTHSPLVPEIDDLNTAEQFSYYYNTEESSVEYIANYSILMQLISELNQGTQNIITSNLKTVPDTDYGTYSKIALNGFETVPYTADRHALNKKYFGTRFTIDETENVFEIQLKQAVKIPVVLCLSGHIHDDRAVTIDGTHHVTLAALANSIEDENADLDEFALTFLMMKNNEFFFFRTGKNMSEHYNPILISGKTNYGIEAFKDKSFKF